MDTKETSNSYMNRWDRLIQNVMGDFDIYDYHINIGADGSRIIKDMTKGSVRLQTGMFVSVPEIDKMEKDFINLILP